MDLILPSSALVIWQTLGFAILLFILAKFAWRPILNALEDRERSIESALKAAEVARNEMANLTAENERILHEARVERDLMLQKASETAKQIVEEAKESASIEGKKLIENAKAAIETEKKAALEEVKVQVSVLSIAIAEKLLRNNLSDPAAQKALVEEFVNELNLN